MAESRSDEGAERRLDEQAAAGRTSGNFWLGGVRVLCHLWRLLSVLWYALSFPFWLYRQTGWLKSMGLLIFLVVTGNAVTRKCQSIHYVLCDQSPMYSLFARHVLDADCEVRYVPLNKAVALASKVIDNPLMTRIPQVQELNTLKLNVMDGAIRVSISSLKGKDVMERQLSRLAKSCGEASNAITRFSVQILTILDDIDLYREKISRFLSKREDARSRQIHGGDSQSLVSVIGFQDADRNLAAIREMNDFAAYVNISLQEGAQSASFVYDTLVTVEENANSAQKSVQMAVRHEWNNFVTLKWDRWQFWDAWSAQDLKSRIQAGKAAVAALQTHVLEAQQGMDRNALKFNVARDLGAMNLELKALHGFEVTVQKAKVQAHKMKQLGSV